MKPEGKYLGSLGYDSKIFLLANLLNEVASFGFWKRLYIIKKMMKAKFLAHFQNRLPL